MSTNMRIGINGAGSLNSLNEVVEGARKAEADGFHSFWIAQIFGVDALTALAVAGREVPRIELGTAVVPTFPRHPMMLAGQALTTQVASGNRLALGIGLSHQVVVEAMWGYSWEKPVRHMREYLDALLPMLQGEQVAFTGEDVYSHGGVDIRGAEAPQVLVAALGAQMLKVAGERGCGTITWCTGAKTLAEHVVPKITAAAEAGGHGRPRVVADLPVVVTADPDGTRDAANELLVIYGGLPSYRAMLDLEGVEGPADVGIYGDEAHVTAELQRLADAGVTDFGAVIAAQNAEDHQRTWDLLKSLL